MEPPPQSLVFNRISNAAKPYQELTSLIGFFFVFNLYKNYLDLLNIYKNKNALPLGFNGSDPIRSI